MHPLAALHLVVFGVLLPLGAWQSLTRLARQPLPPRIPYFVSVIVQQLVFAGLALGVARAADLELFGVYRFSAVDLALGGGFLAAALAAMAPRWRTHVRARDRFVHLVAPRTSRERALWIGISAAAGVGEEIVYRGVFFSILAPLIGVPAAAATGAIAFALGHLAQGWRAAPAVFAFAIGFQLLVIATGALYVAMAVHVVYDVIAGLSYGRLADRYDYPRDPIELGPPG